MFTYNMFTIYQLVQDFFHPQYDYDICIFFCNK